MRILDDLQSIINSETITSQPQSRIEAILTAIANQGEYDGEILSEVEELLMALWQGTETDIIPTSEWGKIIKAAIDGEEYDGPISGEISQALIESVDIIGGSGSGGGGDDHPVDEWTYVTKITNEEYRQSTLENPNIYAPNLISMGESAFAYSNVQTFEAPLLETVSKSSFQWASSLSRIKLSNCTSVLDYAFNQSGLTQIDATDLPKVTTVGSWGFRTLTQIRYIDLPSVASITGASAFASNSQLIWLKLGGDLSQENLPNLTFQQCSNLTTLILSGVTGIIPTNAAGNVTSNIFKNCTQMLNKTGTVYVPSNLVSAFQNETTYGWGDLNIDTIEDAPAHP